MMRQWQWWHGDSGDRSGDVTMAKVVRGWRRLLRCCNDADGGEGVTILMVCLQ